MIPQFQSGLSGCWWCLPTRPRPGWNLEEASRQQWGPARARQYSVQNSRGLPGPTHSTVTQAGSSYQAFSFYQKQLNTRLGFRISRSHSQKSNFTFVPFRPREGLVYTCTLTSYYLAVCQLQYARKRNWFLRFLASSIVSHHEIRKPIRQIFRARISWLERGNGKIIVWLSVCTPAVPGLILFFTPHRPPFLTNWTNVLITTLIVVAK